jgi:hypothetical protein
MADNEEAPYERERSRSRERGDQVDYNEEDVRGGEGSQDNDTSYRRERNNGSERRHDDADVHNLYVTNLSFQVQ